LITLILAGTYEQWTDAIAVFVVTAVLGAWRAGRVGKFPQSWISLMGKIPMWGRLIVVVLIGFVVSYAIQSPGWNRDNSFRPVMISALVTVVFVHLLFPVSVAVKETETA
jgi:predicted Co/Zn/Cd cation transporter (cation efflux family)